MPTPDANPVADKFKRYRLKKASAGLKLVRLWVLDPAAPGFAEEARRQAALLRDAPEEADALALIDEVADREGWDA